MQEVRRFDSYLCVLGDSSREILRSGQILSTSRGRSAKLATVRVKTSRHAEPLALCVLGDPGERFRLSLDLSSRLGLRHGQSHGLLRFRPLDFLSILSILLILSCLDL